MVKVERMDLNNKADKREFIQLVFQLYKDNPLWVPPIRTDAKAQLNPEKHPFYEHSEAAFFLARRNGEVVGRIASIENKPYNQYHNKKNAQFYFFECIEDFEVAEVLFEKAFEWSRGRGLTKIVGPKGLSAFDGYGILIEGYEHRPAMTMMNYNPPYYREFVERLGFSKEVDFVSCYLSPDKYVLPERIHRIAERAKKHGHLEVLRFKSKKELLSWAPKIGQTYNKSFINNWEYYPLTDKELDFAIGDALSVADPRLIKIILHEGEVVGFLLAFPDASAAIQRCKGRLFPFGIIDILIEFKRTDWVVVNGAGILPEFQGRGGNALLYSELHKTITEFGFKHCDMTQVAESAVQMSHDLVNLGGVPYKRHRVYTHDL